MNQTGVGRSGGSASVGLSTGVLSTPVAEGYVAINTVNQEAHALTGDVAAVWAELTQKRASGLPDQTVAEIVDALVGLGLLTRADSESVPHLSRRRVLQMGAGTLALAGVSSIVLPTLAAAASDPVTAGQTSVQNGDTFNVPAAATVYVTVIGGGGGGGGDYSAPGDEINYTGGSGGAGSAWYGYITNTSGSSVQLTASVGGAGAAGSQSGTGGASGSGLGSGGTGGVGDHWTDNESDYFEAAGGGGGGGSSAVSYGTTPLIVAGGGGGGGGAGMNDATDGRAPNANGGSGSTGSSGSGTGGAGFTTTDDGQQYVKYGGGGGGGGGDGASGSTLAGGAGGASLGAAGVTPGLTAALSYSLPGGGSITATPTTTVSNAGSSAPRGNGDGAGDDTLYEAGQGGLGGGAANSGVVLISSNHGG